MTASIHAASSKVRQPGPLQGVLLVAIGLLSTMAVVLLAPSVPAMAHHFGDDPHTLAWVTNALTFPALCVALLSPFAGAIVDRFGRRRALIASLVLYVVAGTAPLYLATLPQIVASRLCVGIAETVLMTASITMLGDLFQGRDRERYLALNTAIASLSATVFFALGGILAQTSWRLPYAVYFSALLFLFAVLAFTWEPERRAPTQRAEENGDSRFSLGALLAVGVVTVAGGITFMTPQIQLGVIAAAHGFTEPRTAGMIGAIGSLAMPVGAFVFNLLRKRRVGTPWLVILAFELAGCGLLLMAHAGDLTTLTLSMVLHEFGCGFMLSGLMTWMLGLLPYSLRGKGTGTYMSSFFISQPICGFLFGHVQGGLGGDVLHTTALFGVGALIVGVLLLCIGSLTGALRNGDAAGLPSAQGSH
ncbi:MFS transporter [Dyella sp. C9]|uniref:MFS transporter n=1 Tax=Dyella sp. C9 TaxID=2202154 RepID=UPI000DEFA8EF|nr:MFS transporter [Dyella sp. C9]